MALEKASPITHMLPLKAIFECANPSIKGSPLGGTYFYCICVNQRPVYCNSSLKLVESVS